MSKKEKKRFHLESLKLCQISSLWKFQLNKEASRLLQCHYNFFPEVLFLNLLELRNNWFVLVFKQVCITVNIFISCQKWGKESLPKDSLHLISQHKCDFPPTDVNKLVDNDHEYGNLDSRTLSVWTRRDFKCYLLILLWSQWPVCLCLVGAHQQHLCRHHRCSGNSLSNAKPCPAPQKTFTCEGGPRIMRSN